MASWLVTWWAESKGAVPMDRLPMGSKVVTADTAQLAVNAAVMPAGPYSPELVNAPVMTAQEILTPA